MSDSETQGQPQDRTGRLLRRMTLANLGLDDLSELDDGAREALAESDQFAARINRGVTRLEDRESLSILSGMPSFLHRVQERYVPLAVDTEFGLDVDLTGPRSPGDVGPWQKLIDGVHLMLFDEDEEGDFVAFNPAVRKRDIQRAVTRMAREKKAPASMPALQAVRKQLRLQEDEDTAPVDAVTRPDFMTISESARASLFGPQHSTQSQPWTLFTQGKRTPSSDASPVAPTQSGYAGLPGIGSMDRATFGADIARRHGLSNPVEASSPAGIGRAVSGMLGSLRGVRLADVQTLADAGARLAARHGDPRIGAGQQVSSLSELVGSSREGYQYLGSSPGSLLAIVPEAAEAAAVAGFHGVSPQSDNAENMRAVPTPTGATGFVSSYPSAMGRAGMIDVRAFTPSTAMTHLSADLRGANATSMTSPRARHDAAAAIGRIANADGTTTAAPASAGVGSDVRERLLGFTSLPGRSGRLLQALADEPVARLAEIARMQVSAPMMGHVTPSGATGTAAQSDDATSTSTTTATERFARRMGAGGLLSRRPMAPSTLGFEPRDLVASLGAEGVADAAGRLTQVHEWRGIGGAGEFIRGAEAEPGHPELHMQDALIARALAERSATTITERALERTDVARRVSTLAANATTPTMLAARLDRQFAGSDMTQAGSPVGRALTLPSAAQLGVAATSQQVAQPWATNPVIYGDVALEPRYLRSLTQSLDVVRRSEASTARSARLEHAATGAEERTIGRLDKMLSVVGVGGRETAEIRSALSALQRIGAVPSESRLAWQNDIPVLITPREGSTPIVQDARSILRSASNPAQVRQLMASPSATVLAPEAVTPASTNAHGDSPTRLDRFSDLSRMFGPQKALGILTDEVLQSGDRQAFDMLRESMVGEVARFAESRSTQQRQDASASAALDPSTTDSPMAARAEALEAAISPVFRRLGMGESIELRLPNALGVGGEVVRMAVAPQRAADRRSALSMRHSTGQSHMLSRPTPASSASSVSPGAAREVEGRRSIGETASGLMARLDVEPTTTIGRSVAEGFSPQVLGLARHEERVDAEVSESVEGFTGLLGALDETQPIRITSEGGESLRLTLGTNALTKMLSGSATQATARGQRSVPVHALQNTLREVLTRRGATTTSVAAELQQRISGLSLDLPRGVESAPGAGMQIEQAARAIGGASMRFETALAATAREPRFFQGILPTAFDSSAPSRGLAMAYESPMQRIVEQTAQKAVQSQIQQQAEAHAARVATDLGLDVSTTSGEESLSMRVASRTGVQPSARLDLSMGSPGYEMVRPSSLSRVLKRFAPETPDALDAQTMGRVREMVDASVTESLSSVSPERVAPTRTERFANLRGEPGQLSDVLERFVPTSAAPRTSDFGAGGNLIGVQPRQIATSVSNAPGSLGYRLEMMQSDGDDQAMFTEIRQEVETRLASQGASMSYVEPSGMTDADVSRMFNLGSGGQARRRGGRHEMARMLDRLDGLIDGARSISERPGRVGAPGALAQLKGVDAGSTDDGLPQWKRGSEHVQGIELNELKDLLRQVGATPIQGSRAAIDRQLVNPYSGQTPGGMGADPLFSGGAAAAEAKPSNQVQEQEAAFSAADVGLPPYEELMFIADEVYQVIMNKLQEEFQKRGE